MNRVNTLILLGILTASAALFSIPESAFAQVNMTDIHAIFVKPDPSDSHPYFASLIEGGEVVQTGSSDGKDQIYWSTLAPGTYNLKIESPGYKTLTMCVQLLRKSSIQTLSVRAKLSRGEGEEVFWKGHCLMGN